MMPIEYHIDHGRRLVIASASGKLTAEDFFNYNRNAWALPDVRRFNELVDASKVEEILSLSPRSWLSLLQTPFYMAWGGCTRHLET